MDQHNQRRLVWVKCRKRGFLQVCRRMRGRSRRRVNFFGPAEGKKRQQQPGRNGANKKRFLECRF